MPKTIWTLITIIIIICLAALVSFQLMGEEDASVSITPDEIPTSTEVLTAENCGQTGGAWDECGSACRGDESIPCIEICVEYCECVGDHECPANHHCVDYVEDLGVCELF
jgi:hypothetical protein